MFNYKDLAATFDYKNPTKKIFAGRSEEIRQFSRFALHPGAQIAVFGDRSIGKTSFVRHVLINRRYAQVSCQKNDNFESIFKRLLQDLSIPEKRTYKTTSKASAGGILGMQGEETRDFSIRSYDPDSIASFFEKYEELDFIFFDEFDLLEDPQTKENFALLMKFFSDRVRKTKIIIAGIGENISDLIAAHSSSTRFLSVIHLQRMSRENLAEIMTKGEQLLGVKFAPRLVQKIVTLSEGFPFFTHLFSFGVLESYVDQSIPSLIEEEDFEKAILYAYNNANHRLQDNYNKAINSKNTNPETSEQVLWACAEEILVEEIQTKDILARMQIMRGNEFKQQNLSNYLGRFTKEGILDRIREGRYKFRDPLMKIYVNISRRMRPEQSTFLPS